MTINEQLIYNFIPRSVRGIFVLLLIVRFKRLIEEAMVYILYRAKTMYGILVKLAAVA